MKTLGYSVLAMCLSIVANLITHLFTKDHFLYGYISGITFGVFYTYAQIKLI